MVVRDPLRELVSPAYKFLVWGVEEVRPVPVDEGLPGLVVVAVPPEVPPGLQDQDPVGGLQLSTEGSGRDPGADDEEVIVGHGVLTG